MKQGQRQDVWAAGDLYEPYIGRWSRLVARGFLRELDVPPARRWLDIGCGTGALTQSILDTQHPSLVAGVDPSPAFIGFAKAAVASDRAAFEVADARALPFPPETFDAVVSGLMLNFVPQPHQAVNEMARVVRPDGFVAAYVWDYSGRMELMRHFWNAAVALDPAALDLDEGRRFPVCQPQPLAQLFTQAELRAVDVHAIEVPTHFRDFDDYWSPFLGGQAPAPGYAMSLTETRRDALRDRIRSRLPIERDGSIRLIARAWVVRGRK